MNRQTSTLIRGSAVALALGAAAALAGCGDNASACDEPGFACTWLGLAGEEGFNGDGLHRLDTKIYWSMDMLFAADGTPWFIDWNNHLVRKVLPDDTVQTVIGSIDPIFPGDGVAGGAEKSDEGAFGLDVQLNHPTDFAQLSDGRILLMAWHNHKLRSIDPNTDRVKIQCGGGAGFTGDGGPDSLALFRQPKSVEVDEDDNIYILDQQNFRIRRIGTDGIIDTIAGNGTPGFSGDGGLATEASFGFEAGSNPEPSGGMTAHNGVLYVADTLNNRIRAIDLETGIVETIAGTGERAYGGDGGLAIEAAFNRPRDIEIGPDGHLYVADTNNNRIRAIDLLSGRVRTVAGNGDLGLDEIDGKPAIETTLRRPFGIEFDRDGNLFISDTINSRILRVAK